MSDIPPIPPAVVTAVLSQSEAKLYHWLLLHMFGMQRGQQLFDAGVAAGLIPPLS